MGHGLKRLRTSDLVLSVTDGAYYSVLRRESALVQDVIGLSRNQSEVKPLQQFCHHKLGLHLKVQTNTNTRLINDACGCMSQGYTKTKRGNIC